MSRRFIILWTKAGWSHCFEADMYAASAAEAREKFAAIFPSDIIKAVRLPRNAGAKWYQFA